MSTGWTIATIVSLVIIGLVVFFELILPRLQRRTSKQGDAVVPPPAPPRAITADGARTDEHTDEQSAEQPDEETGDEIEEDGDMTYQQLIEQGDRQLAAFEYDDAVTSYDSATDKIREELGRDAIELAAVMVKLGKAYQARDDGEDDEDYFTGCYARALAIMEQHWGPFDQRLLPVLQLLIAAEDQNGKQSEADGMLSRIESITAGQTYEGPLPVAAAQQWSAETAEFAADGDKAMTQDHDAGSAADAYWSGLESACEKHGNDSLVAADLWFKHGQAVQARDDDDDDEEATTPNDYLRALAIMQQHLGPFNERLVPVLHHLISFYDQVGLYNKAEGYMRRLRTIARHKAQSAKSDAPATA